MSVSNIDYLYVELKRLDLLLHRQILRLRGAYQLSLDEFRGLYISDVVDKAFIGVDEYGTEAAAATADIMNSISISDPPIPFVADRSFLFFILLYPSTEP